MIQPMIEEVQDLHIRVHGEELTVKEITDKYECRLTSLNIEAIRNELILLHHQMLYGKIGLLNENDL